MPEKALADRPGYPFSDPAAASRIISGKAPTAPIPQSSDVRRSPGFWDTWHLGKARYVSTASKDPSTKCGCVIIHPDRAPAGEGYNGFPRGTNDLPEMLADRPTRLLRTVHAEANAILHARQPLNGCTLYVWPFPPCATCAGIIVQAGIARVVAPVPSPDLAERWAASLTAAAQLFAEAGVKVDLL